MLIIAFLIAASITSYNISSDIKKSVDSYNRTHDCHPEKTAYYFSS